LNLVSDFGILVAVLRVIGIEVATVCGRDLGFPRPPAQIPASGTTAPGSYLKS